LGERPKRDGTGEGLGMEEIRVWGGGGGGGGGGARSVKSDSHRNGAIRKGFVGRAQGVSTGLGSTKIAKQT